MYYIASIAALTTTFFILPASAQETPSLPDLCESIKRIQDRVVGQVIEVEGKHSNNFIEQLRPTPFTGKFDESRFWCRRELPSFEMILGEETFAFKGMSGIEIGVVANVLVQVDSIEHEPRFSIAFADRDKAYVDVNLFAGLFLAFGKLPEFKQVLNQDDQSFLVAMLSHPNARLEAIAGAEQQYQVECIGDDKILVAHLKAEPELHCTQLDIVDKATRELSHRYLVKYHQTDLGWMPKSSIRAFASGEKMFATYDQITLRADVPNSEFLPDVPDQAEVSDQWKLLDKFNRLRSEDATVRTRSKN